MLAGTFFGDNNSRLVQARERVRVSFRWKTTRLVWFLNLLAHERWDEKKNYYNETECGLKKSSILIHFGCRRCCWDIARAFKPGQSYCTSLIESSRAREREKSETIIKYPKRSQHAATQQKISKNLLCIFSLCARRAAMHAKYVRGWKFIVIDDYEMERYPG